MTSRTPDRPWPRGCPPSDGASRCDPSPGTGFALLLLPAAFALAMVAVAFVVRAHRDLGSGVLAERAGPAPGTIATTGALALRLNRGVLLSWAAGITFFGVLVGSLTSSVSDMIDSPTMQRFFEALGGEKGIIDAFLAAELAIVGSFIAAYGISAAGHLHGEESVGHADLILATPTSRWRWASSHFGFAVGGVTLLMVLAGLSVGLGNALDTGDAGQVGELTLAGLAQAPAAWVLAALVWPSSAGPRGPPARSGVCSRRSSCSSNWAPCGTCRNGCWTSRRSCTPRSCPATPRCSPRPTLTLIAAALTAFGYLGWRRRDLAA